MAGETKQRRQRRSFTDEFKAGAIRLVLVEGKSIPQVARDRGGSLWLVLTPDELVARLATLVPPPRVHAVRYHGVFAAHSKVWRRIVPQPTLPSTSSAQIRYGCPARKPSTDSVKAAELAAYEACPAAGITDRSVPDGRQLRRASVTAL